MNLEQTDLAGLNPHAEIPPQTWRSNPSAWVELNCSTLEAAAISLQGPISEFNRDLSMMPDIIDLLSRVHTKFKWERFDSYLVIRFGDMLFPTSPEGTQALDTIRAEAIARVSGRWDTLGLTTDSVVGSLIDRIDGIEDSALLQRTHNMSSESVDPEIVVNISCDVGTLEKLPTGQGPSGLLTMSLEGMEISGSDVEDWRQESGACLDGTADFLSAIGVSFETEGGYYECDSCGCEHESGEDAAITHCDDFVMTRGALKLMEKAGYLESFQEWVSDSDRESDWSELLSNYSDAQILEKFGPGEEGLKVPESWTFEPALWAVEAIDDVQGEELIRLVSILQRLATLYESAGQLPPIPGKLLPNYRSQLLDFDWDPASGELSHKRGTVSLVHHLRGSVVLRDSAGGISVPLKAEYGQLTGRFALGIADNGAARWVRMSKSSILLS